ncbi:MAG TPA: hypothetical protein DIT01_12720, partial [Lentisphaeria bacterium]|nr:hypothetical protein [Lentisphaeria bacterium]
MTYQMASNIRITVRRRVRIFVVLCVLSLSACPSLTQAGVLEDKTEELLKGGERPENMGCAWGDYN